MASTNTRWPAFVRSTTSCSNPKPPARLASKRLRAAAGIVVEAQVPGLLPEHLLAGVPEELLEERVDVEQLAGRRVHQPDALARGLEDAAVTDLRGAQRDLGALALGDVLEGEQQQRLRLARHPHPPGVDPERFLADPLDVDRQLVVLDRSLLADRPLEQPAEIGLRRVEPPELQKRPALRLLRRGLEHAVEGLVRRPDAERLVEDHEGLAHGLHEGLGDCGDQREAVRGGDARPGGRATNSLRTNSLRGRRARCAPGLRLLSTSFQLGDPLRR